MAEGKNKIIVYADWLHNFEDLSDEELGKLMRHFFMYVNDLNPVLEDRFLKLAWKPIETTLKRDLKKWEQYVDKQRLNGAKGGRPKNPKNPSLYIETQQNPTKPKKGDSVSDSVSVSVKVIDILDRKYKFSNTISKLANKEFPEADAETIKEFCDYWTEHGDRDKKMRFEKQKSFNNKLRFNRWLKNQKEWKKEKSSAKKEKVLTLAEKMKQDYGIS